MRKIVKNSHNGRLGTKQLGSLTLIGFLCLLCSFSVLAESAQDFDETRMLQALNPYYDWKGRAPGSFTPNDEVDVEPERQKIWLESVLVEDDAGVMTSVRSNLAKWEEEEEYAKSWNLESTGLYDIKTGQDKKDYLNRHLLKYLDKRLAGEVKNAEEGSTLHQVGQAQKALRPNAEVGVTETIKFKFKARVLQGKAFMYVINPYVDYSTTVNAKGEVNMNLQRSIAPLDLHTSVDYNVSDGSWVAMMDRPITDNVKARVSSSQSDKDMAFTEESNQKVELLYNQSF